MIDWENLRGCWRCSVLSGKGSEMLLRVMVMGFVAVFIAERYLEMDQRR
jgi:hypothetical protein